MVKKLKKISLVKRGFLKRCPICGISPIFSKYIKTFKKCKNCGLNFTKYKSDDGPSYFTIFAVGHIIIPLILLLEKNLSPPLILQMILWPLLTIILSLWLLPRIKGTFIAIQITVADKSP